MVRSTASSGIDQRGRVMVSATVQPVISASTTQPSQGVANCGMPVATSTASHASAPHRNTWAARTRALGRSAPSEVYATRSSSRTSGSLSPVGKYSYPPAVSILPRQS